MQKTDKTNRKKRSICIIIYFLAMIVCPWTVKAESGDRIADAKNGIVEVVSGFSDKEGVFHKMKSASGFLIGNTEGRIYIVTNNSVVQNSSEAKEEYCRKYNISADDYGMADSIRIIVKGDVAVEAAVMAGSGELDFCILSTENVVNEKTALKLGDPALLSVGSAVYALGFPNAKNLEYVTADVEIYQGNVQDKEAEQSERNYIQHSAVISESNTGGPLLDEDGYVVGINCKEYSDISSGRYYSLPVSELTEVLDNFAIAYDSRIRDELQETLLQQNQECHTLYESGAYKKTSLAELQQVLEETDELLTLERPSAEDMETALEHIASARKQLVPKMEKLLLVTYVLAGCILLCLIRLAWMFLLYRKEKKDIISEESGGKAEHLDTEEKEAEPVHGERYDAVVQNPEYEHEETAGLNYLQKNKCAERENNRRFANRTLYLELTRERTGQAIEVNQPEFKIGKHPDQVDYFISDNKTISRKHACISWKNNTYYICDLGSANGTCLNGTELSEGLPEPLHDGDTAALSDEGFRVRIFRRKDET